VETCERTAMRICVVGGVAASSGAPSPFRHLTPETILVEGLRAAGVEVFTASHSSFVPRDEYDIVHVHHVGRAAFRMASSESRSMFVFTGHDSKMLCGYERNPIRRAAFQWLMGRCDAAVALSPAELAFLGRIAPAGKPIAVIPNGVASHLYSMPRGTRAPAEPPQILYVGQLIAMKGVDVLLRAMQRLLQRRRATLVLAYHNGELEARCRQLAQRLGISEHVRFAGFVYPQALPSTYRGASVLVLPSYAESLPSVITEAMLCGVPVVATNIGGIAYQLGPFGTLVPPGDADALASALVGALEHPLRPDRQVEMTEYARGAFSVRAMIEGHLALYERTLRLEKAGGVARRMASAAIRLGVAAYWSTVRRGRTSVPLSSAAVPQEERP
jgi:glycosyltransferase involved in cell wall biosynthesis